MTIHIYIYRSEENFVYTEIEKRLDKIMRERERRGRIENKGKKTTKMKKTNIPLWLFLVGED